VSVSLSVDGPGDAELISAVRGGDSDAYGELFARHVDAARRLARQLAGHADADDLVSDAFTKVLTVLQRGGGPDLAFRAYLLTAVRRLHVDRIRAGARLRPVDDLAPFDPGLPFHDTAIEGFDNAAAARAFASLPERWQMVLWHTEVEQQKPADIAPLLGMSANSVSALAYRAREGLRQAFLSQHATDPDDVDCAWTRDHLGAYVRGGLSRRDSSRVDDHLAACRACAAVYLELTEVNSGLAALLAPLLLGTAGASYLTSTGAGSSVVSTSVTAAKTWVASHASLTAVGGMVVTAAAVLSIYGASQLNGHGAADLGSPPQANRGPVATALPTSSSDGNPNAHHTSGGNPSPSDNRGVTQRPGDTTTPLTTPPVSDDSTAPVVNPGTPSSDPTSGPTDPTTGPTDPTTGPTDPSQITFLSTPPDHPAIGSTYDVSARGGSGGLITFSVDPATTNDACSIADRTVTFDHAGTCVIAAALSDGGSASKARPARATQSIEVPQTAQTVTFESSEPDNPAVDGTYTLVADSSSGRPVTLSVDPTTTNDACAVSGSVVSFHHVGTCVVAATQEGDADLASATATQSLEVAKGTQSIDLQPAAPSTARVGASYEFTVTGGNSGNQVVVTTSNTDVCAISGSKVSFFNPGNCVISANQAGNDDYDAAPTVTRSVNVVSPTEADLAVSAEQTGDIGGHSGVTATVSGLPPGSTAHLTVTSPENYSLQPEGDGGACTKTGPATFSCLVTSDQTQFVFSVNVHGDPGRGITFAVAPDAPLTDPDETNNSVVVTVKD
jgi:RNA polymerase sigma factor (sigma-70 family)